MRWRDFIVLLGGLAAIWPVAARAQQPPAIPVIGYLHTASPEPFTWETAAFRDGLKNAGYVEGKNITIEYRWAEGKSDRVPSLADDLVHRQVRVIAAIGGDLTALAAKALTTTIPIVFLNGSDPIRSGLVASLNKPGGNVTGISLFAGTLDAKRLQLLHELVPQVGVVAMLDSQLIAESDTRRRNLQEAARAMGIKLLPWRVTAESDFDRVFADMVGKGVAALFVDGSPFFLDRRDQLAALAARHAIPAIYAWREFAVSGGLMSYGTRPSEAARQAGAYVGRILGGEKPANLPVVQPTKFELVINLRTAKALGLTIPPMLLARADEVIE